MFQYFFPANFQVVAFSFYGNPNSKKGKERKYFNGIKDNLKVLPEFYKDWVLRYIRKMGKCKIDKILTTHI